MVRSYPKDILLRGFIVSWLEYFSEVFFVFTKSLYKKEKPPDGYLHTFLEKFL